MIVGYKKEYFFYLKQKYGVKIANNDEYASRNNNGSLWRVREELGNTYVCSSDDYFTQNPFEPHVFKAYYSAQYAEGPTKEWCMTTCSNGRIVKVAVGGSDSWYMLGHVYFDRAFSQKFVEILEAEYDRPETTDKLWEDLYIEHIKELDMDGTFIYEDPDRGWKVSRFVRNASQPDPHNVEHVVQFPKLGIAVECLCSVNGKDSHAFKTSINQYRRRRCHLFSLALKGDARLV